MFLVRAVLVLTFVLSTALGYIKEKPPFMRVCYKADPEVVKCATEAVQLLIDNIHSGFPAVGIEPLDPFKIQEIKFLRGGEGPVTLNASFVNVTMTGLSNTKFTSNKMNFDNYGLTMQIKIPRLNIEGVYTVKGRIIVLPLAGHGDGWLQPEDVDCTTHVQLSTRSEDGLMFFKVQKVRVNFTIGNLRLHFSNLFNGQKTLEDSTNEYINNNWRPLADAVKPVLTETIANIATDVITKLFDSLPAEFFYGDLIQ